ADGDALVDGWEDGTVWLNNEPCPGCTKDGKPGIDFDGDGVRDLILCDINSPASPGVCASKTHKDVFVEIDYMTNHLPDATARTNVINAFAAAPVTNPAPDGPGIRLHLQLGEEVPHTANLALEPCTPAAVAGDLTTTDFDVLKQARFGTPTERLQGGPKT